MISILLLHHEKWSRKEGRKQRTKHASPSTMPLVSNPHWTVCPATAGAQSESSWKRASRRRTSVCKHHVRSRAAVRSRRRRRRERCWATVRLVSIRACQRRPMTFESPFLPHPPAHIIHNSLTLLYTHTSRRRSCYRVLPFFSGGDTTNKKKRERKKRI